jgi:hypothetical protein
MREAGRPGQRLLAAGQRRGVYSVAADAGRAVRAHGALQRGHAGVEQVDTGGLSRCCRWPGRARALAADCLCADVCQGQPVVGERAGVL